MYTWVGLDVSNLNGFASESAGPAGAPGPGEMWIIMLSAEIISGVSPHNGLTTRRNVPVELAHMTHCRPGQFHRISTIRASNTGCSRVGERRDDAQYLTCCCLLL